jgi:hypothetical protein
MNSKWEYPDIEAMLAAKGEATMAGGVGGGFGPFVGDSPIDLGEYIIDPDYMEVLGIDDPTKLIKYRR